MDTQIYSEKLQNLVHPKHIVKPIHPHRNASAKEYKDYALKLEEYEKAEKEYRRKVEKYRQEQANIREEFKLNLFKELGIENNPKRDLFFKKAWESGHAYGFNEVYNCALDLVDLIT